MHKLLVAQGISTDYVRDVEIIDIEDANKKCSNLDSSVKDSEGANGGLDTKSVPWICGGLDRSVYNTGFALCWTLKDRVWQQIKSLLQPRAYSGKSMVSPGSYLFTGGAGSQWRSTKTVERKTNDESRSLTDLGKTIYQHCQVRFNQTLSFTEFYQRVKILDFPFLI